KLSEAIEAARHEPNEDKEWNEFDYERLFRESDARTDKYGELLDKYQDHPDRDRIVAREMGWTWLEEALDEEERRKNEAAGTGDSVAKEEKPGDDPFSDEEELDDFAREEPDPAAEGVDWVRVEGGDIKHPLSFRAFESSIALWERCKELG